MLLRWFKAHYPTIPVPEETAKVMATKSSWDMHDRINRITDLFLNLARTQHSQDQMDPDLQIALGVLFYTNGNYNQAQDCFAAALNVRPKVRVLRITMSIDHQVLTSPSGLSTMEQTRIVAL